MIYYHVSEDPNLPSYITPRIPKTAYKYEPKIRRICVSPSVLGCIRARYSHSSYRKSTLYLYRVFNTRSIIKPSIKQVHDAVLTSEHWIIARSRIELIGELVNVDVYETAGYVDDEYRYTKYIGKYDIKYKGTCKIRSYKEKIGYIKSKLIINNS